MKVIIVGAGELGRLLASTLLEGRHDVVLLDSSEEELERAGEKLEILTVEGSCASVAALKKAGIDTADALLAVSGNEPANILACHIASKLGVSRTICRLYDSSSFSEEDRIGPESLGIWRTVSPAEECAGKICSVLENSILLETILFTRPHARMAVIEITRSSSLAGVSVKNIPGPELLKNIRFAAILRGSDMIVPHGDTIFAPGDKVYVAGLEKSIRDFIEWVNPPDGKQAGRLIVRGAAETGLILARRAAEAGYEVCFIEPDEKRSESLLDELPAGVLTWHGNPTREDILQEAGISSADVFASVSQDDEDNILSCILAKRMGARKVICLTHKPEYVQIVPSLEMIDCGLSATLVSVNAILRHLESGTMRVDAILQRFRAHLSEYRISPRSPLCGRPLEECRLPQSLVLALVFRGPEEVLSPSGKTVLNSGDVAGAIVPDEDLREIQSFFPEK